jgi:hypothetical protein
MSDTIVAPEGIEFDLVMYLTSDSAGISTSYAVRGLPAIVPFTGAPDAVALAKEAGLTRYAGDWRMMTRAEVEEFKDVEID